MSYLAVGRQLVAGDADLVELEPGQRPGADGVDLVAAAGPAVHVAPAGADGVTVSVDTGAGIVDEPVGPEGVRLVSAVPLPGWSRPTPTLHPRLGALAIADGAVEDDGRPRVRAVVPADTIVYLTSPGSITVSADRDEPTSVESGDAVYLGPHDVKLRLVSLPGVDAHGRVVSDQRPGLARFVRRLTTIA